MGFWILNIHAISQDKKLKVSFGNLPVKTEVITNIKRFQKVDDVLYRGGLPEHDHILALKRQGFTTIINLKGGHDAEAVASILAEKTYAQTLGMKFVQLPIDSRKGPDKKIIDKFFETMDFARKNNERVFLHCKHGRDRTGVLVALYEVNYKVKTFHAALCELFKVGYNQQKHPQLFEIIKKFAKSKRV